MTILALSQKLRPQVDPGELYPAIAVVAFDLGEENRLIGGEGRMLAYDLIIAIATLFEHKHRNTNWEEQENDWESSLHLFTGEVIELYDIPVKDIGDNGEREKLEVIAEHSSFYVFGDHASVILGHATEEEHKDLPELAKKIKEGDFHLFRYDPKYNSPADMLVEWLEWDIAEGSVDSAQGYQYLLILQESICELTENQPEAEAVSK